MPFSIVCVAPGASEAQVIELVKAAADPSQTAITQYFSKAAKSRRKH